MPLRNILNLKHGDNRAAMIYPGEGKKGQPRAGDYVLTAEQARAEAAASPHRSTAVDLARADKWEGQACTKQLPSTRSEIGRPPFTRCLLTCPSSSGKTPNGTSRAGATMRGRTDGLRHNRIG